MKETEHSSNEVLVGDKVALGPRYDRLDDQLLKILYTHARRQNSNDSGTEHKKLCYGRVTARGTCE